MDYSLNVQTTLFEFYGMFMHCGGLKENDPQMEWHSSEVLPCRRKNVTLVEGFEVSFSQTLFSVTLSQLLAAF